MKKEEFNELFLDIMMKVKGRVMKDRKNMHIQKRMYLQTLNV